MSQVTGTRLPHLPVVRRLRGALPGCWRHAGETRRQTGALRAMVGDAACRGEVSMSQGGGPTRAPHPTCGGRPHPLLSWQAGGHPLDLLSRKHLAAGTTRRASQLALCAQGTPCPPALALAHRGAWKRRGPQEALCWGQGQERWVTQGHRCPPLPGLSVEIFRVGERLLVKM